jgi:hypothetical protein
MHKITVNLFVMLLTFTLYQSPCVAVPDSGSNPDSGTLG